MPITPLPQFEADLAEHLAEEADREAYERLNVPTTIVVRFGALKMVGEFPWRSDAKPGCGSKIVVRTSRGTEIGEMLTSTCPNAGCSKSVTRQEMLEYIKNSGGKNYPFESNGEALRIATKEDLDRQAACDEARHGLIQEAKALVKRLGLPMTIADAEPLLGGERITWYYVSEERVDFRALVQALRERHSEKVELRQVGARDEARLTADYERCGQYCCCKNFLKVLKPISMRSAKIQKATLDPLKISGRCGRLMCCLRYEDETYDELRKRLPHRKTRVGTPEGDGVVIDSQILTQLVLVELDGSRNRVAIPVEELTEPGQARARDEERPERDSRDDSGEDAGEPRKRRRKRKKKDTPDGGTPEPGGGPETATEGAPAKKKKKRRRRRKKAGEGGSRPDAGGGEGSPPGGEGASDSGTPSGEHSGASGSSPSGGGAGKKKKRRRRRKKPGGDGGPADGPSGSAQG
ncbi:MAG: stage 0 sporulation family protein [Phycisphaerales bacterium JB040]